MTFDLALLLAQDGITNGAVYALLALALVLVYTVTRVIFVPQGEFVSYGALTLASIQLGICPGTVWLLGAAGGMAAAMEVARGVRNENVAAASFRAAVYIAYPAVIAAICTGVSLKEAPLLFQVLATLAIVVPLGPLVYSIAFRPLVGTSVLMLLIAAVAVHFVLVGAGLLAFGPEGFKTAPIMASKLQLASMTITAQSLWILAVAAMLIASLFWFFGQTLYGKALRATAVNRVGARLVGIRPEMAGMICFTLAAFVGAASGILISPVTTIYYDSGFLIGLKGFVAAIVAGLASYPVAAVGAGLVGLIESFSSFWASAFKEAILFTLIIPVLLWRSFTARGLPEDAE